MIDLFLSNLFLLGAALVIGILTARWAFPKKKAPTPAPKQEDEATP
ncbi:MAG TPA: hypothetical protein VMG08_18810 [Allosphingosinicella sp.]|nr:hypothetical protein [Allosphingosinicella sp.]